MPHSGFPKYAAGPVPSVSRGIMGGVEMTTRDELAAINEGFAEALADQDVDRVIGFYTDDARLLFCGVPMVRGRSEIAAMFREDLDRGPLSIRFETIDVLEEGSLVVDVGRYVTPKDQGKYVVVHQRQPDGTLKIAVDAASSDGSSSSGPGP